MLSPLLKAFVAKVELLEPTLLPLRFHWYEGEAPALNGVAVKVTDEPGNTLN
jgi:hypothetical protein